MDAERPSRHPKRGRAAGFAIGAALLLGAAWFLRGRAPTAPAPATDAKAAETAPRAPDIARLAPRAAPDSGAVPAGGRAGGNEPAGDAPRPGLTFEESLPLAPANGPVVLTVRYVGAGEPPSRLVIGAIPDDRSERGVRLEFPRGVVEGRLPAAREFAFSLRLDGWESDQRPNVTVPATNALAVEVMLPQRPTLRVVDAVARTPIAGAFASSAEEGWSGDMDPEPLPGRTARAAPRRTADAHGLFVFEKTARARRFWVGAPGHAWAIAEVAPEDRERVAALEPGGNLRVDVEGAADPAAIGVAVAFVKPPAPPISGGGENRDRYGPRTLLGDPDPAGRYALDGLGVGHWLVTVGRSNGLTVPDPVAESDAAIVELRAGETTEVRLRVKSSSVDGTVRVEVLVPAAWGPAPPIDVAGIGDVTSGFHSDGSISLWAHPSFVEGPPGTWTATFEKMPAGPYQVSISDWGFAGVLRVGKSTTSARVEVPPPARLRVRVLDAVNGRPVASATVRAAALSAWSLDPTAHPQERVAGDPEEASSVTAWTEQSVVAKPDDGVAPGEYVLRVPAGRVDLKVSAPGRLDGGGRVDVSGNDAGSVQEVRLAAGAVLVVRTVRSGSVMSSAEGTYTLLAVAVETYEANDEIQMGTFDGGSRTIDALRPGTYRVRLKLTGVEKELAQEVVVKAGEEKTVDFEVAAR